MSRSGLGRCPYTRRAGSLAGSGGASAPRRGIRGLWQVSGRNAVDFEEWMRLDLFYVDRWSLAPDLKILLRIIPVVLRGEGAS